MPRTSDFVQMKVRLPKDLHDRLKDEADRYASSINSEIIRRVRSGFEQKEAQQTGNPELERANDRLNRLVVENKTLKERVADLSDGVSKIRDLAKSML